MSLVGIQGMLLLLLFCTAVPSRNLGVPSLVKDRCSHVSVDFHSAAMVCAMHIVSSAYTTSSCSVPVTLCFQCLCCRVYVCRGK